MPGSPFMLYHTHVVDFSKTFNWDADNHRVLLLNNTLAPDLALHIDVDDIDGAEISDADYVAQDVAGETVTLSGGLVTWDLTDPDFGDPKTIAAYLFVIAVGTVAGAAITDKIVGVGALNLDTAVTFDAAAVTDTGGGTSGLPSTAHGYATNALILVKGTDNYDGWYLVLAASTTNVIHVTATFVAETLATSDTAEKALQVSSTAGPFKITIGGSGIHQFDANAKAQLS